MNIIFKYQLIVTDHQPVPMPKGAQILSIQMQRGDITVWALVDPEEPPVARHFHIYGTGHEISETQSMTYLATVQDSMNFVWHIFEAFA